MLVAWFHATDFTELIIDTGWQFFAMRYFISAYYNQRHDFIRSNIVEESIHYILIADNNDFEGKRAVPF